MTGTWLILIAIAAMLSSGVPGLFLDRRSESGGRIAAALLVCGSLLGVAGALWAVTGGAPPVDLPWGLPIGRFSVALDAISLVFLVPVFLVPALGAIYGLGYWSAAHHADTGRRLRLFYGVLAGSMALLVIARDSVLFLMAWESMALAGFFLITTEDDEQEVQRAGWVYLVATHVGTLCLFAMFALLRHATGTFAFDALAAAGMDASTASAIFLLAIIGFGLKAGIMPLHVWLPGAHANAPSHVSAVLSGVMIKMGIYGIVRVLLLLPAPPPWWGGLLLTAGAASGLLAIAFAIGQDDLKRLLAYSSIENIGIICIALGLALIGRATGHPDWAALGLAGALLHVWNHSFFKPALFFGAGAILHATGTRNIAHLGGLSKRMPRTALYFTVAAVAIAGLPPLNGFVSELLVYVGLFTAATTGAGSETAATLAAPALAMIGALTVVAFVKALGLTFLGEPRTDAAAAAHEVPASMTGPMAALVACCALVGLAPFGVAPVLDLAVRDFAPMSGVRPIADLVPLLWVSGVMTALVLAAVALFAMFRRRLVAGPQAGTWDCGYIAPTARMQYVPSSFGQMVVSLFSWALWPRTRGPAVIGRFPAPAVLSTAVPDTVLDRLVVPVFRVAERALMRLRFLQQGKLHLYVLYILVIVIVLMVWK